MKVITNSREETCELGRRLGEQAKPGDVLALSGDLGTGKTVFAQGFAKGLGIRDLINSPTFTIQEIHEGGRLPFYHYDVYRIEDIDEMEEIGYEEFFYGEGVCLIEWAEMIEEILPDNTRFITIRKNPAMGDDYREIEIREGS